MTILFAKTIRDHRKVRRDIRTLQKIRADKLLENTAFIIPTGGGPELKELQAILTINTKFAFMGMVARVGIFCLRVLI